MYLLIITGLSGAGKSHALRKVEDMGYFCVDNLPAALLRDFVKSCEKPMPPIERAAVVMDVRERCSLNEIEAVIKDLKKTGLTTEVLFLDARDEVIITRYKETRRAHPFSRDGWVEEGVRKERAALTSLRAMADYFIDTSGMKPAQMYNAIERMLRQGEGVKVLVSSFGYKHGVPLDADWVFDMRFLPNPFYVDALRRQTGLDEGVRAYVFGFEEAKLFFEDMTRTIERLIPLYEREDKHTLSVAIGCTGGQHRSVAFAQEFHKRLCDDGCEAYLYHRDVLKGKQP